MAGRAQRRKSAARQRGVLLALLALLGGLGTWNYQQNLAAERAEVRPYRTLSDADLATLIAAVESEAAAASSRYELARGEPTGRVAADGDRFEDFERAQQRSRAVRELGQAAAGHEAMLAQLRDEQGRRAGQGDERQRFLRRLFGTR